MKKHLLVLCGFIITSIISFSQETKTNNDLLVASQSTYEQYVIGIDNDINTYFDVLSFIKNSRNIKIYASCDQHKAIGITVNIKDFKSFDVFESYLKRNFYSLEFFERDKDIFSKDCQNETLKQK